MIKVFPDTDACIPATAQATVSRLPSSEEGVILIRHIRPSVESITGHFPTGQSCVGPAGFVTCEGAASAASKHPPKDPLQCEGKN